MTKKLKEKSEKEIRFNIEFGKRIKVLKKELSKRFGRKITNLEIANKLKVKTRSLDYYLAGKTPFSLYDIHKLIKSFNLSIFDINMLFYDTVSNISESANIKEDKDKNFMSENPDINKKILILKDIYESGDETLICGVDLCLKGAYDDFLAKKRKKAS
jgi:hypothetical protein